jgi:Restriction endonuclease/DnaJ domain
LTAKHCGDYIELTPMLEGLKWRMGLALAVTLACALDSPEAAAWQASRVPPDLSTISSAERHMIESACHVDRQKSDPAAYPRCVREQLDALQASPGSADLTTISGAERQMIGSACHQDGQLMGPAAYYRCVREQLDALLASGGSPDLNTLSSAERQKIESACQLRQMSGPASYYRCLRQQVDALSTDHPSSSESHTTSGKTASPPQDSPSQQSENSSGNSIAPPAAAPAGSPAVPQSGADSAAANGNQSSPHPESSSARGTLLAWLAGLVLAGFIAKILYDQFSTRKCVRCGDPIKTRGGYCAACLAAMEESARRGSEQRAAEERAQAEAERYAREQWEIEESRQVTVLAELHRLTDPQFHDLIASLFRRDGYIVRNGGGNGDEGIDLMLRMGQEKDVVQCKRSKSDIELPVVREFYGALMHAAARHGFVVTTASFSQGARDFARGKPISLVSAAEILQWMNGAYSSRGQGTLIRNANGDNNSFDPYAVLGVSHHASAEEIRAAYHREMVNYHPDKVAHLGKELQELAKTKTQEINRAYEELARSG